MNKFSVNAVNAAIVTNRFLKEEWIIQNSTNERLLQLAQSCLDELSRREVVVKVEAA